MMVPSINDMRIMTLGAVLHVSNFDALRLLVALLRVCEARKASELDVATIVDVAGPRAPLALVHARLGHFTADDGSTMAIGRYEETP